MSFLHVVPKDVEGSKGYVKEEASSRSSDLKSPETQFISGNAIITEENLRRDFRDEKGLGNLIAGLKHMTSLDGQASLKYSYCLRIK